ncbi:succinate dehydrogenase assembly factor 2, mitochondrial [Durio zibethinus]|uniref:Succinate dehydrogenase assembly factor 2, mitochondrial n=1 Tax=Durio zibethinus TaxID=66656 RepID=A0A6P5YCP5_DURZI|nr:succinate dehydrogenase assembly factor 2, mitochondrial [Durio zibethinus]
MATLRKALLNAHRVLNSSTVPNRTTTIFRPQYGWISRFSYSNISNTQPLDIDLSTEEGKRRLFNRLLYRSKQRGFLELDLVLGKWVEEHIYSMDETGIKALVHVLDLENPDLWKWLTGQEQPPEAVSVNPVFSSVQEKVLKNLNNHSAPETRATPGQPWVRGWDDIKKGPDSPITGNQ